MSKLRRDIYRPKLARLLSHASDEGFVRLVWAVDLLQSGGEEVAKEYLNYPAGAASHNPHSGYYAHKWFLESLVNELLVVPKVRVPREGHYRTLNYKSFTALATAVNHLRQLEEAADGISLERVDIFEEMTRIGHKQFEWQVPALHPARFYRAMFLYGGEICSDHFRRVHGLELADFSLVGFALFANFRGQPGVRSGISFADLGVDDAIRDLAFKRLVLPISRARVLARELRPEGTHIGYRKSVLRQFPCIAFGDADDRIRAPLCDLILRRVTDGLYYDVVSAGGDFRDEIGNRFERYALDLINANLPELNAKAGNRHYKFRRKPLRTPDILIGGDRTNLVVECKANRMTFEAKFSTNFLQEVERAHDALAHGVFQVWRFFSHCRQGAIAEHQAAEDSLGVVLTMDPWLIMSRRYGEIIRLAHAKADAADEDILSEDRKPVAFCSIEDFEHLLSAASADSLRLTIRRAATDEMSGWHVSGVHREIAKEVNAKRPYPFTGELKVVMPWWKRFGQLPSSAR